MHGHHREFGGWKVKLHDFVFRQSGTQRSDKHNRGSQNKQSKMSYKEFKHVIGSGLQADIFLEHLTVREYFKFAIDLRESGKTKNEKKELLDTAVKMMKMERAEKNLVGGIFRKGILGGEKKRLNIGFELLGDPSILFLDGPTSGLDSYTSFIIMTLLRQIAQENNIIVIYTIHQSSIEIFDLFDNLMIFDKGRNIYFGKAQAAIDYYAQMNIAVSMNTNPANHYNDCNEKT